MIAVIFEAWPALGKLDAYMDLAAELRPYLEKMDGFISIERFRSLTDPDKLLSLSFWRDEAAIEAWRNMEAPLRSGSRSHRGLSRLPAPRRRRAPRLRPVQARGGAV